MSDIVGLTGIAALEAEMRDRLAAKDAEIERLCGLVETLTKERDMAREDHKFCTESWHRQLKVLDTVSAERAGLRAQVELQRQALEDVVNPLGALKRHADAEGGRLNSMAASIANSINYVQDIARRALLVSSTR